MPQKVSHDISKLRPNCDTPSAHDGARLHLGFKGKQPRGPVGKSWKEVRHPHQSIGNAVGFEHTAH